MGGRIDTYIWGMGRKPVEVYKISITGDIVPQLSEETLGEIRRQIIDGVVQANKQYAAEVVIRGDIVPRRPDMKPEDVIVKKAEFERLLETLRPGDKCQLENGGPCTCGMRDYYPAYCESQTQTTTQDYLSVLTAVMNLTEGEQQMIYEALYKAGRRIYR